MRRSNACAYIKTLGIVAGRNAIQEVSLHAKREQELKDWEARLATKEMELNGKLAKASAPDNVELAVQTIYKVGRITSHASFHELMSGRQSPLRWVQPRTLAACSLVVVRRSLT